MQHFKLPTTLSILIPEWTRRIERYAVNGDPEKPHGERYRCDRSRWSLRHLEFVMLCFQWNWIMPVGKVSNGVIWHSICFDNSFAVRVVDRNFGRWTLSRVGQRQRCCCGYGEGDCSSNDGSAADFHDLFSGKDFLVQFRIRTSLLPDSNKFFAPPIVSGGDVSVWKNRQNR